MTMNSINTNAQSLIALQSLNVTNEQLSATQKRVTTGFRVSDARDDGGAFAVAQSVKSDMAGVVAVNEQLGGIKGVLETTFAALSVVSDTMKKIRATLTRLADGAISRDQRATYEEQYRDLVKQVESFVDDAFYNGRSLLSTNASAGGGDIAAVRNEAGGVFTIEAVDGDTLKLDPNAFPPQPTTTEFEAAIKAQLGVELGTTDPVAIDAAFALLTPAQKQTKFNDNKIRDELAQELEAADPAGWAAKTAAEKTTAITTAFSALTPAQKQVRTDARVLSEKIAEAQSWIQTGGDFDDVETEISSALNQFGTAMSFVENQMGYNSEKLDSMTTGLGSLVDADLARESSALEALKVRQQLGVQTLSLANQGPQVLLGLFR
jgi:flagellin